MRSRSPSLSISLVAVKSTGYCINGNELDASINPPSLSLCNKITPLLFFAFPIGLPAIIRSKYPSLSISANSAFFAAKVFKRGFN